MSLKPEDLHRVIEFRERLVAYMNRILQGGSRRYGGGLDADARRELATEQLWLAPEYGRLYGVINRYGGMSMSMPAIGITSVDVIQDAIHDVADPSYNDIARLSIQHLDTVIGRLQAELERRPSRPTAETIYRVTSPVYWLSLIARGVAWVWGSNRRRIAAVVGALLLTVIGAFVSGVAQALVQQWLARP